MGNTKEPNKKPGGKRGQVGLSMVPADRLHVLREHALRVRRRRHERGDVTDYESEEADTKNHRNETIDLLVVRHRRDVAVAAVMVIITQLFDNSVISTRAVRRDIALTVVERKMTPPSGDKRSGHSHAPDSCEGRHRPVERGDVPETKPVHRAREGHAPKRRLLVRRAS